MDQRQARFTILLKLMCVMGALVVAIVGFLGAYFPSRQLDALSEALHKRSETYARLAAKELQSTVAFNDKETAREIFAALSQDNEVEAIVLFSDSGETIHDYGKLADVEALKKPAKLGLVTEDRAELVVSAAPVISLEGPRGIVFIALSKRSLADMHSSVRASAFSVGLATLALGLLAAWLLARALSRRLRVLADSVARVAAGDLEKEPPTDTSGDEIGALTRAFKIMLAQLRELFAQIKATAQKEQERLEHLVADRTRDLDARNRDMRLVLDNVGQGFVTIDAEGKMSRERSAILKRWFGHLAADTNFCSIVAQGNEEREAWFRCCLSGVFDDFLPIEVALDQLPKETRIGEYILDLEYRAILSPAGAPESVLIVVSDVTKERARASAEIEEKETQRLISRLLADRAGFYEFLSEVRHFVGEIASSEFQAQMLRDVHTLKGITALFGLETLPKLCHELETSAKEAELEKVGELIDRISSRWNDLERRLEPLLASSDASRVEIDADTHRELVEAVETRRPYEELQQMLTSLLHEPVRDRLARMAEQARAMATRLNKGPIDVSVEADRTRLDPREWSNFWSVLSHVVRNAVDHGLESSEERESLGKSGAASLRLATHLQSDGLVVEIADSGRGIDWASLRKKAENLGMPSSSTTDLVNAMFTDGISTKTETTEISGRGIGLAAVRAECEQRGGKIEVKSTPGQGTSFIFRWPTQNSIHI